MNSKLVATLAIIGASMCWSIGSLMTKTLVGTFDPLLLLTIQLSASTTILWAVVLIGHQKIPSLKSSLAISSLGALEPGLAYLCSTIGLQFSSAGAAALIFSIEPALITVLSWLIVGDPISGARASGLLLSLTGVILVGMEYGASYEINFGLLLILLSTLLAALYVTLNQSIQTSFTTPVIRAALQQSFALTFIAATCLLFYHPDKNKVAPMTFGSNFIWMLVSGIVQYAFAFWLFHISVRKLSATHIAPFLCLIPVFTVVGAYIYLDEQLGTLQCLGAALIISALIKPAKIITCSNGMSTSDDK